MIRVCVGCHVNSVDCRLMFVRLSIALTCCFFFFKQKTAYEMRISDWSSDVCSSDLQSTEPPRASWRLFGSSQAGVMACARSSEPGGTSWLRGYVMTTACRCRNGLSVSDWRIGVQEISESWVSRASGIQ